MLHDHIAQLINGDGNFQGILSQSEKSFGNNLVNYPIDKTQRDSKDQKNKGYYKE